MIGGAKPIRIRWIWVRFKGSPIRHACRHEVYADPPNGVSFTHGIGACGEKGTLADDAAPPGREYRCRECCARLDAGAKP